MGNSSSYAEKFSINLVDIYNNAIGNKSIKDVLQIYYEKRILIFNSLAHRYIDKYF